MGSRPCSKPLARQFETLKETLFVTRNEVLSCWWARVWYQIQNSCCTTSLTWASRMMYNKKVTFRGSVQKWDKTKAHTVFSRPSFLTGMITKHINTFSMSPHPAKSYQVKNVNSYIYSASYMWVWNFEGTPSTVAKRPAKLFGVCLLDIWLFDCLLSKQRNQNAYNVVRVIQLGPVL